MLIFRHQPELSAREMRADRIVDEIISIADNEPDPHRARVMVDTRKWVASKFYPKMYADRLEREATANVTVVFCNLSAQAKVIEGEANEPKLVSKKKFGLRFMKKGFLNGFLKIVFPSSP